MREFIVYLNISVRFGHANMKKLTIYYTAHKNMDDNIGKMLYQKLPYNTVLFTTLERHLDRKHCNKLNGLFVVIGCSQS